MEKRKEFNKYKKTLLAENNIKELICARCGLQTKSAHLHHIIELYKGGENKAENLIPLCPNCHGEWDYYSAMKVDFQDFLLMPSLFAIIQGMKNKVNQEYISTLSIAYSRTSWKCFKNSQ